MRRNVLISYGLEGDPRPDNDAATQCALHVQDAMDKLGISSELFPVRPEDFSGNNDGLLERIKDGGASCVFNLFEGFSFASYREVDFADVLERSGIPFTGNGKKALRKCLDKHKTKEQLSGKGVPVPGGTVVRDMADIAGIDLDVPLFIKPCCEDGSVGITRDSLVTEDADLSETIARKLELFPKGVLVEEFIPGVEINAGFVGTYPYRRVGVSMLDYSRHPGNNPFLRYAAKWDTEDGEYKGLNPVVLDEEHSGIMEEVSDICCRAAKVLGCEGYFRVDLREKEGEFYVIDVNPNPDISPDSGFVRQARHAGLDYKDVVETILNEAV